MRVERNLDFVWQGIKNVGALREQSAVGCEYRDEAFEPCHTDELRQMGMQKRLAHKVEIQELHLACKPVGERVEFVQSHCVLRARRLGAKHTVEIAYVGYLKIASGNHLVVVIKCRMSRSQALAKGGYWSGFSTNPWYSLSSPDITAS